MAGGSFLELQPSDLEILVDLGLTLVQAKIYLVLAKSEQLKVTEISKFSNVARPDVYRTLSKLHNLGLVEEIVETPRQYKAIPLAKGIIFLLERQKKKHDKLRKNTELLLNKLSKNQADNKFQRSINRFLLIPKKERIVNRIRRAIEESQETVDLVLSLKRFLFGITVAFAESSEKAWGRGVRFRFIVEKPEDAKTTELVEQFCKKNPSCEVRFWSGRPKTVIGIYDKKEVFLILNPGEGLFDSPALWSNSLSLITVVQDYFNILWLTSLEKL